MIKTYAHFDRQCVAILRDIVGSEPIHVLEERYDNGRMGRVTEWFGRRFGGSPTTFRRKAAAGQTAFVTGSFYFLDATRTARRRLASTLARTMNNNKGAQVDLPDGDYQIWVVDNYTCVLNADDYQKTKTVYRKIYKHELNLDHPDLVGELACLHSTDTRGVPLPDSTLAYLFNLIWLPDTE